MSIISGITEPIGDLLQRLFFKLSSTAMTLSIEEDQARLLVLKKNQIISWTAGQIAQPPDSSAENAD